MILLLLKSDTQVVISAFWFVFTCCIFFYPCTLDLSVFFVQSVSLVSHILSFVTFFSITAFLRYNSHAIISFLKSVDF